LNCPVCSQDTRVLQTRDPERRRECTACGHRFTTTEILKDDHERRGRLLEQARALAEGLTEAG
jgi:transcriptional regulator NrdR family protein